VILVNLIARRKKLLNEYQALLFLKFKKPTYIKPTKTNIHELKINFLPVCIVSRIWTQKNQVSESGKYNTGDSSF